MSYLVLARKWRPQNFEQVVGQNHVTRTLKNAIKENRLAHALLYSGPRGVGKTTVARIVAKALNCKAEPENKPCNKCDICKEIAADASVDVLEIDGASNRGIDEIRQLRENIYFKPTRAQRRIYIIDEVHMLTKEAFNALLKTLEEPPSHVVFQLATTEPHKVPATIRSRCQHYEFRRLSISELASHLEHIVKSEGLGLDKKAIELLAREAKGSVRDSLSLLDQVVAYGAKDVNEVCDALGITDISQVETLAFSVLTGDIANSLEIVKDVYAQGRDIVKFSEDFARYVRDLCVLKSSGPNMSNDLTSFGPEEAKRLYEKLEKWPQELLFQAFDILLKGLETISRSSFPRMVFEMLLIKLAVKEQVVSLDAILEKFNSIQTVVPSTPAKESIISENLNKKVPPPEPKPKDNNITSKSKPEPISAQQNRKPQGVDEDKSFKEFVRQKRPSLGSLLSSCKIIKDDASSKIVILCKSEISYDYLKDEDNIARLETLAQEFWKDKVTVQIDDANIKRKGQSASTTHQKIKEELINSPLVQEAIKVFDARISEVKPFKGQSDGY